MSNPLDGKVAVITAAGSGIGRASALAFARDGAAIVVNDIGEESALETVALIESHGGRAIALAGDVTSPQTLTSAVAAAVERFGKLDILFNNAGGQTPTPTHEITPAEFARIVELNLHSMFYGVSAALPVMRAQHSGVIITTTSGAGIAAVPGLAAYGAAKAGLISLTRSIAVEYGHDGIRANVISPGSIEAPGLLQWLDTLPGGPAAYASRIPSGRLGVAQDIAEVAAFLASDKAAYLSGALIPVDGAVHARLAIPAV